MGLRSFADCTSCVQASEDQRRWRTQSRQSEEGAERDGSLLQSATGKEAVSVSDWPACFQKQVPCCAACLGNPSVVRLITLFSARDGNIQKAKWDPRFVQTAGSKAVGGVGVSPTPSFARDLHVCTHWESTSDGLLFHQGIRDARFYCYRLLSSSVLTEQSSVKLPV